MDDTLASEIRDDLRELQTTVKQLITEMGRHRLEEQKMREALFGNGKVGFAEEVRILRRGYRAAVWMGAVIAAATLAQAVERFAS